MSRETKPKRSERKKPLMSLKERRAKKHAKKYHSEEHRISDQILE